MNINTRISELIEILKIKQKDFAERINLKSNTLSMIKSNKRNVTERVINDIVREFDVNEQWLLTGEGNVFNDNKDDGIEQVVNFYKLSKKDEQILQYYVKLDSQNREIFYTFIRAMNIKGNNEVSLTKEINPNLVDVSGFPPDLKEDILKVERCINNDSDITDVKQTALNG